MKNKGISVLVVSTSLLAMVTVGVGGVTPAVASSPKSTITVVYPLDDLFDTAPLATKWWNQMKVDFTKKYPNVNVNLVPVPGSEQDLLTKLSLLLRSSSNSPDVIQIPSSEVGLYASSNYLLPINKQLSTTSWFSSFPTSIKNEAKVSGNYYAVSGGEMNSELWYNKTMFKKAGIQVPWQPKNWQDIISAAQKIHKTFPTVTPLFINTGTAAGTNGLLQGINNFIVGSSNPTIQTSTGKMVVDSSGIKEALTFYHTVYSDGLGAPLSELNSPDALNVPTITFPEGKLAIALGGNFFGGNWSKTVKSPYWPQASKVVGIAQLPKYSGNGTAGEAGGWDLAISKSSKNAKAAFDFIKVAMDSTNLINADNWAGLVPPAKVDWTLPAFTNFAAPYNAVSAQVLTSTVEEPASANYPVWAQGMGEATEALAQNPSTTVAQAESILKNYVTNQLGASAVTTLK